MNTLSWWLAGDFGSLNLQTRSKEAQSILQTPCGSKLRTSTHANAYYSRHTFGFCSATRCIRLRAQGTTEDEGQVTKDKGLVVGVGFWFDIL